MAQLEKLKKTCFNCETKYTIIWDVNEQDLNPLTCPFCGFEVGSELEEDEIWTNEQTENEDDNWN